MTSPVPTPGPAPTRIEHVGRGAILALLTIPVGLALYVLLANIGFIASVVSFVVAFGAYWLYQRGAGGVITRTGAWVVTVIVAVTVLLGVYAILVSDFANAVADEPKVKALGKNAWDVVNLPNFWNAFNDNLSYQISQETLTIVVTLLFGVLGSFRILRNAFRTTSARPTQAYPQAPTASPAQTTYRNDVDAPPTGSADDKTTPPTSGV